jgi:transposase-like protein
MDFSGKQFPKEVIIMAVRWYLGYALSGSVAKLTDFVIP